MTTRVPIRYGGTGANTAADARTALGVSSSETTNAAYAQANSAFGQANDAYDAANTANTNALAAYAQANLAYDQANSAYSEANLKLNLSGGTISGDLIVSGNLEILGNSTTLNVETLLVEDNEIILNSNVAGSPTLNAFITVNRGSSPNTFVKWDEDSNKWGWSDDGSNTFYFSTALDAYDAANTANTNALTAYGQANDAYAAANTANTNALAAYDQANLAYSAANSAYDQANSAYAQANDAYSQANTAYDQANSAYASANTANTNALAAYDQANLAYSTANSAYDQANDAYSQANTAYAQANSAYTQANDAYSTANTAYNQANTAYGQANDAYSAANTANTNALAAYGQANAAFDQANSAFGQANLAYDQANTAYGQANDAYSAANTANTNALAAYGQANAAFDQANTAYGQANDAYSAANTANTNALSAYGQANDAYAAANSAANTVRVSQNSGSTLSAKQLNFVNTANVTISVTDSGDGNANIEFEVAAGGGGTLSNIAISSNSVFATNANAFNFINTSTISVTVESGVDGNANISFASVGAAANLEILDEGSSLTAAVTSIDFVGPGVTATANGSDVTVTITGGGGGGTETVAKSDVFTAANGDANLTYSLTYAVPGTDYVFVNKNGIALVPGTDFVVDTFQTLRVIDTGEAGDIIEAHYFTPASTILIPNTDIIIDTNTVTAQTNTFYLSANITSINLLTVTKNGLTLTPNSHFTLSDNNTITLTTVAEVDDELVFRFFRDVTLERANSNNSVSSTFTANGSANVFFMDSHATSNNNVLVTIDGVVLIPVDDYTVDGPILTINYMPPNGAKIEARTITGGGDGSGATLGFVRDSFVGDGNTVNYTLTVAPYDEDNCLVYVDRVLQRNNEYNVSTTTLTFDSAPDANAVIDVFTTTYKATSFALMKAGDTMTGNLNVSATLITQNVEPVANVTYDLGTNTKRFKDLWLSNSTIYLGEATISANGGNIVVPSIQTSSGVNVEAVLADAYNQANSAFDAANNRVLKAGDTMTGLLNVANSLIVTGNVGVGTATPSYKLDVYGDNTSGLVGFFKSNTAGATYIRIDDNTSTRRTILGSEASTNYGFVGTLSNDDFAIRTNNSERFRITSNGSVCISTDSPIVTGAGASKLTLYGDNNQLSVKASTRYSSIYFYNPSGNNTGAVYVDNNSNKMVIEGRSGGVAIGGSTSTATDQFTISPAGIVTIATQPSFMVKLSGTSTIAHVTETKVPFNSVDYDVGSNFNTSTNRFTAPLAGKYLFCSNIYVYFTSHVEIFIYVNGSVFLRHAGSAGTGGNDNPNGKEISAVLNLAQNDYVEIYALHARAGDSENATIYHETRTTCFSGIKIA